MNRQTNATMRTHLNSSSSYDFYLADLDNLIRVENRPDGVLIRASRDNVSERRKSFFIHELAAEGYIPDCYQWLCNAADDAGRGARWIVDYSWLRIDPQLRRRTSHFILRLLAGAGLVWLLLLGAAFLSTAGRDAAPPATGLARNFPPAR
jgi:hypothetical protein